MLGLIQDMALTTGAIIDHAASNHGRTEVVARRHTGEVQRSTWGEVALRARRFASALKTLGLQQGDRVATLAWNRLPHLETYYAVTAAGHVLHTLNPRLFHEQIRYVFEDGGARVLCVDPDLLAMVKPLLEGRAEPVHVVVFCAREEIADKDREGLLFYEDLVQAEPLEAWPELDERQASGLCYTSGTTGPPKGVLYSHRSTVLHALSLTSADALALSALDSILLLPPMFHVNAWGVPFAAAICGAKLVLPGNALDGASLHPLLRDEQVTFSLAVPTVWFSLLDYIEAKTTAEERQALRLGRAMVGGAATPRSLAQRFWTLLNARAMPAWGMTETSPVAAVVHPLARHLDLSPEEKLDVQVTAGRSLFGIQLRIESPEGEPLPRDGKSVGRLKVKGAWVLDGYFGQAPGSALDAQGWFDTGDVGVIDEDGFLRVTDRAKDVIKSGGEWISSIEIENAAAAHPAVLEAAVIGVPHPRWQERPLLLLRLRPGAALDRQEMLDFLASRVARWWLPDDVVVVDDLPHTGSGKVIKAELRRQYFHHLDG